MKPKIGKEKSKTNKKAIEHEKDKERRGLKRRKKSKKGRRTRITKVYCMTFVRAGISMVELILSLRWFYHF